MKLLFSILALLAICHSGDAQTFTRTLNNVSDCRAHLHVSPAAKPHRALIVDVSGTGIYERESDFFSPVVQYFFETGQASVLTVDKPGIRRKNNAPPAKNFGDQLDRQRFDLDEEVFFKSTQEDLEDCLSSSLIWAVTQPSVDERSDIFLFGHSEGAQLIIMMLDRLQKQNSGLLKRIPRVLLSGLFIDNWKTLLRIQNTKEKEAEFWRLFNAGDEKGIKIFSTDVGLNYWKQAFNRGTLIHEFERILTASPNTLQVHVFQGLNDKDTPASLVRKEEIRVAKMNGSDQRYFFRYYQAGHLLNQSAVEDMLATLRSYLYEKIAK